MASPPPELPPHSDNVEEELNRVCLALEAVFSPGDNGSSSKEWWERRQLADRYLTSFQSTSISWIVCDRLLQRDGAVAPVTNSPAATAIQQQRRFFAAQTLLTKCRSDVYQLPPSSLPSLRDSLMDHLTWHCQMADSALTTRLAMCVSALAVQMGWTSIITDLLGALMNANNANHSNINKDAILLLLRALPEECASDRLLLEDENVRYKMRDHFISNSALVFQFFQASRLDHGKQTRVYEAFHNWIRHVPVLPSAIAETPLLENVFQTITTQPEMLEIAADILVEIFRMYPSHHEANEVLVNRMAHLVFSQLSLDQALSQSDEDVQRAYCRIVTEMGESYLSLILSVQHAAASQFVEWVLRCSTISETDIASITLHFWYRLVTDLEQVEPYEMRQDLVDTYAPFLLRLIDACCTHLLRYPSNFEDLSDDNVDDIHRDRFYVAETVEDCCRLLGGHVVLARLGSKLRDECQRVSEQQKQKPDWQGIEACLFAIQCIHRFTANDEAEFLPGCFSLIPQLPPDIWPLRVTASMMIGKYAAWLASHPEILPGIWSYLTQGLSNRQCAPTAATAIKELCENSNQQMSVGEPVLQLYQEIINNPGRVELKDELEILEGLCKALSRQVLHQQVSDSGHLAQLVQPIGDRLASLVSDPSASSRSMVAEIERLIVVVRCLVVVPPRAIEAGSQQPHPMVALMSSIWALLDAASQRYPHDVNLAEKICRLHKHALRAIGAVYYAPLLDSLVEQLVRSFDRSHLSPYLYAGSICVTEYGRNPAHSQRLFEMVHSFSRSAFSFLRSLEDLIQHPDVVEEFFYLMGRVIIYCPGALMASPQLLTSLLQCAAVGLQLDHRDANRGTLNFLENAVTHGLSLREQNQPEARASLELAFQCEGQEIVQNLARALWGDLPTYSVDEGQGSIAGILWKLNVWSPNSVASWMTATLTNNDAVPERAKLEFLAALDSGLAQSDFNLAVRAFMSACDRHRRYRRGNRHP